MSNETSGVTPPNVSFTTLSANYPLPYDHRPDRTPADPSVPVSDDAPDTFLYYNQCAIRMSLCLKTSGIAIAGVPNLTNPGGDAYTDGGCVAGAFNLASYIKGKVFGQPAVYDGTKNDCATLLSGKTGIMFFQFYDENFDSNDPPSRSESNVHIDLWNQNTIMAPYLEQMLDSTTIWFWQIA